MDIVAQSKLAAVQKPDVWECKKEKIVCQPASISIYTYDDCFPEQSRREEKKLAAGCMNLVVAMSHQSLI